jgi:hypothetical protein
MKFSRRNAPVSTDIPIASVRTRDISSSLMVRLIDYSYLLPDNNIPVIPFILSTIDESIDYKLKRDTIYPCSIITNEFFVDDSITLNEPLWYKYSLSNLIISNDSISRTIKRKIREGRPDDRILKNIVKSSNMYIVENSVTVSLDGENIPESQFFVDYARKWIYLPVSVNTNEEYTISFIQTPINIKIDNPVGYIRISPVYITDTLYMVNILSSTSATLKVTYNRAYGQNQIQETTEYTTPELVYSRQISDDLFGYGFSNHTSLNNIYIQNERYIYTNSNNKQTVYAIGSKYSRDTNIALFIPEHYSFQEPWYPYVLSGSNFANFIIPENTHIIKTKHKCRVIDKNTISIGRTNIIYNITRLGLDGITVYKNSHQLEIVRYNDSTGIVTLRNEISFGDNIYVEYSYAVDGHIIDTINLNPMSFHKSHDDIEDNYFIYSIQEQIDGISDIVVTVYPKYINQVKSLVDYTSLYNYVNAEGALKYPIGLVEVVDPFDKDIFTIRDARIFGGGTTQLIPRYDISSYDGESIDLSYKLIYEIPSRIKNDIVEKLQIWDEDTIKSDDPLLYAINKSEIIIRDKVKKFSPLGSEIEVKWIEE